MSKWNVELNGVPYEITFVYKPQSKQQILYINGNTQILPPASFWNPDIDYSFTIEDHQLNLMTIGNKCDLAVDGVFQDSGKRYRKGKIALWGMVFMLIYIALFMAMLIVPVILHQAVSVWIVLAVPLTSVAIGTTCRLCKISFLPLKKLLFKPIIYVFLLLLYFLVMLMY